MICVGENYGEQLFLRYHLAFQNILPNAGYETQAPVVKDVAV